PFGSGIAGGPRVVDASGEGPCARAPCQPAEARRRLRADAFEPQGRTASSMMASNFIADGQGQGPNGACDNMDNIVAELRDKLQAVEALPQWQEAGENGDHREQILHYHTMGCPQFAKGQCAR
ncbi:unnamed protein product, partial [Prorocentrum cordatum]